VKPDRLPARVVSLVPSLTEALIWLGLGRHLVGVSDWCVHPAEAVAKLPKVGGTKTPSIARILELAPDLVIANHEENRRRDVEKLEAAGVPVWVTYPRSVRDGVALLRELAELGTASGASPERVDPIEAAVAEAEAGRPARPARVFCPVWKQPWMSVGRDTYANDMLELCGGENVFAGREDRRYPIVQPAEILAASPEVILLPDEPYAFGPREVAELSELAIPAAARGRIHLIDGTLVSWYGPRIQRAIQTIRPLLAG
jgi:ABC-type Fe3+-hydroxamate transport system substrate-binding protein